MHQSWYRRTRQMSELVIFQQKEVSGIATITQEMQIVSVLGIHWRARARRYLWKKLASGNPTNTTQKFLHFRRMTKVPVALSE